MAALNHAYLAFKDLITSNDQLLEIIADIEHKLEGTTYFGPAYVRVKAVESVTRTCRILRGLDALSCRRYQELRLVFASLQKAIERALAADATLSVQAGGALTYDLRAVDARLADIVGGKSAHVGEIKNRAALPVPAGFAISTRAFRDFMSHEGLGEEIRALLGGLDPTRPDEVDEVSRQVEEAVAGSAVPPHVVEAITGAYRALAGAAGGSVRVAVRSSAVGEDGDFSFAGQYATVLNVAEPALLDAYRQVVSGLYSPSALFYRRLQHIPDEDVAMGVLCMAMVDARAGGVACSVDPNEPDSARVLISGSWGLGLATVGGSVSADVWEVCRDTFRVLRERIGAKEATIQATPEGGLASTAVPGPLRGQPCLSPDEVATVAQLALRAERHYGHPCEIEWAVDGDGRCFVLQARSLTIVHTPPRDGVARTDAHHTVLLKGVPASSGCASGPVWRLTDADALARFPAGAVAVARHSSPQFVRIMGRAAAIVTDVGAPTGHMASLAREFRLPAVLDTMHATETLADGQLITVCGTSGLVYEGVAEQLCTRPAPTPIRTGSSSYALLQSVAAHIVPLALTDPAGPDFSPQRCRSLHDLARFAHEKAFEEMFRLGDRVADATAHAVLLDERLPFQLFLIDLGGGVAAGVGRRARASDVRSAPMSALLAGMLDPGLRWWEPRPLSIAGFLSVTAQSITSTADEGGQRALGDRSYAVVADAYCNFSSRIGYHFAAADAYCSESTTRNYVSFRFKGGAADSVRRARRCEMIAEVLKRLDFSIEMTGDFVTARLRKYPAAAIADRLEWLGRLVVATRQLDMRMAAGSPVAWFVRAFFAGNYVFEPDPPASESRPR
jgi:pyruvate, water dikinase